MLEIDEHALLVALHRTLLEGKFAADPQDRLVAVSPLVAEVCVRVQAALDASEERRIEALEGSRRTLALRNHAARLSRRELSCHPHRLAVVRRRLGELEAWHELAPEERSALVAALAAPFDLPRELRERLLTEADARHGA